MQNISASVNLNCRVLRHQSFPIEKQTTVFSEAQKAISDLLQATHKSFIESIVIHSSGIKHPI